MKMHLTSKQVAVILKTKDVINIIDPKAGEVFCKRFDTDFAEPDLASNSSEYLIHAFDWDESEEGWPFWDSICSRLEEKGCKLCMR